MKTIIMQIKYCLPVSLKPIVERAQMDNWSFTETIPAIIGQIRLNLEKYYIILINVQDKERREKWN